MSQEKSIKTPIIGRSVKRTAKDLHLHINLRLGPDDIAALQSDDSDSAAPPTREELAEIASRIYKARRARDHLLDRDLFGEPAWDMLLALYCLPQEGEKLSITSLSLAADLPQTTGYRWQTILAERGLLERIADQDDGRRQFVTLTDKGRSLLENYLTRLYEWDTPVSS